MAKIDRFDGNVQAFASQAQGTERTIFGDTAQSNTLDANINTDFLRGWGIVGVNENPTKQDFAGLAFTLGQLISYLHQRGIPEWNTSQEFYEGSVVTTLEGIYRLKAGGTATVNPDSDAGVNWELAPTREEIEDRVIRAASIAEIESFTGVSDFQVSLIGDFSGAFKFSSSNLSAEVSSDPDQHTFIAPSSDATGASGAWVRKPGLEGASLVGSVSSGFYNLAGVSAKIYFASNWIASSGAFSSVYIFDSQALKSTHDGVFSVSPTVPAVGVLGQTEQNFKDAVGETDAGGSGVFKFVSGTISTSVTVKVPENYADIQTALDAMSGQFLLANGINVGIRLSSGYEITTPTILENADYSMFRLSAVSGITNVGASFPADKNLFTGTFCKMPTLAFRIDAQGEGLHGIYVEGSSGLVESGSGIINAGYFGLYANEASNYTANGSMFTGAGANNSTESNVDATGISARRGSLVLANDSFVHDSLRYGISAAKGSTIVCERVEAEDCLRHGVRADEASTVQCAFASARTATAFGFYALRGSSIHAEGADANGSDRGFYAAEGSRITALDSTASNCTDIGYYALNGSFICADGGVSNNTAPGVKAVRGSSVDFNAGTAESGSGADVTIQVGDGSFINASGASFETLSTNANTLTSAGVIFT
jgi:hypothetical protein